MDLSFLRFDQDAQVTALPADLAVLMVGVAARQAASPTARAQARIEHPFKAAAFAPEDGAFSRPVAQALAGAPVTDRQDP